MANPAENERVQSAGREANDAQPSNTLGNKKNGGPERYPAARNDDALERKPGEGQSFAPRVRNETAPKPGRSDGSTSDKR